MRYFTTKNQSKLYAYALKLLDFSYEPQIECNDNSSIIKNETYDISPHFLLLSNNVIIDASNHLLLELKKKKKDVIGTTLKSLLPKEIIDYVEE